MIDYGEGVKKLDFNVAPTINSSYIVFRKCAGKHWYNTLEAANKAKSRTPDKDSSRVFEVYKCKICGKFHIGHRRN